MDSSKSETPWTGTNTWSGTGYFPSFPATSPYVTAVGATMGPETGGAEITCQSNEGGVITSGGGLSTYFAQPTWQVDAVNSYFTKAVGASAPAAGYNKKGRAVPDVSIIGTQYPIVIAGQIVKLYGTSASAPVFAAMVSLVNAQRLAKGLPSVGFLNPSLYAAGGKNAAGAKFNDITSGKTNCCGSNIACCASGFTATTGWDPATGWGSVSLASFAAMFEGITAAPSLAPVMIASSKAPSAVDADTPTLAPTHVNSLTISHGSSGDWATLGFVPSLALIATTAVWLSPMKTVLASRKARDLGATNPIPYVAIVINCVGWMAYGLIKKDHFLFWSNVTGIGLGLFYSVHALIVLATRTKPGEEFCDLFKTMEVLLLFAFVFWSVIFLVGVTGFSQFPDPMHQMQQLVGVLSAVFAVLYCASPLYTVSDLLRTKDSSSLFGPLLVLNLVSSILWLTYGALLNDLNLYIPCIFGIPLTLIEMILLVKYSKQTSMWNMFTQGDQNSGRGGGFNKLTAGDEGSNVKSEKQADFKRNMSLNGVELSGIGIDDVVHSPMSDHHDQQEANV